MKKYTPYERGMESKAVFSTFQSIPTGVDGMQISEGLPNVAKVMDRGTLITTFKAADLGCILHSRHQYHWHTGYVPPQTVAAPHIGAVDCPHARPAQSRRARRSSTSASAGAGGEDEESRRSTRPASSAASSVRSSCPKPVAGDSRRPAAARHVAASVSRNARNCSSRTAQGQPPSAKGSDHNRKSIPQVDRRRRTVCSSRRRAKAFDLTAEPKDELRQLQHRPLRSRLPARPAVGRGRGALHRGDDGIRPVHGLGHARERPQPPRRDEEGDRRADRAARPRPGRTRTALTRTLIVLASEFSRDMMIGRQAGPAGAESGRRAGPTCDGAEVLRHAPPFHRRPVGVVLFGGGIKKGQVYGETANERPFTSVKNPVTHARSARVHLPGAGHPGRPVLRGRKPSVLRHRRRQGQGD